MILRFLFSLFAAMLGSRHVVEAGSPGDPVRVGRLWRFPDGSTVPVVEGGDGPLVDSVRARLRSLLDERKTKADELDSMLAGVETEGRSALTETEETRFSELRGRLAEIDTEREEIEGRIAELVEIEDRNRQAEETRARIDAELGEGSGSEGRGGRREGSGSVQVRREEVVYRPDVRASFFADALAVREDRATRQARERIERHAAISEVELRAGGEETRDVGSSAFGGLVVPQYLVEEFAPILRNGRALLNGVRRLPLPEEGMALVIPRGQTGSSTAAQAAQNDAVSETNVDFDNDLTVNVRTFAGQEDVSRQAIERGSAGLDRLVYQDLVSDYAETVDASAIADDGTSGTHVGLLNATGENTVTYTDASPTVPEVWPKLADAVQKMATARRRPPTFWLMHGRRWGWFMAALDSSNRPLLGVSSDPALAMNVLGESLASQFGEGQIVGTLQSIPVVVDNNVPTNLGAGTNEDRIFAIRGEDPILWEEGDGMPRELRFDEVGSASLTVKLLVYGYSAFTPDRRPEGISTISGTGLATPSF